MTVLMAAGGALADPVPDPEPPQAPQDDHGPIDDQELPKDLGDLTEKGFHDCGDAPSHSEDYQCWKVTYNATSGDVCYVYWYDDDTDEDSQDANAEESDRKCAHT